MKKNIREDKGNYVLDASDIEKVEWAFEDFYETFNGPRERKKWPRLQDRVAQWLRGLPTGVHIEYADSQIKKLGKSWGFCQTKEKAARFVNNYWSVLALRLIKLRNILCDLDRQV